MQVKYLVHEFYESNERMRWVETTVKFNITFVWQFIVQSVFCTVEIYMNVRLHRQTTVRMRNIGAYLLPNKKFSRNILIKIATCGSYFYNMYFFCEN